ncbi:MAG: hypothetical protein WAP03_19420 [Methylorubrum rhodinum]|uniref:hypothetical protein n=1 Tax=Methylorubrum rhodinum TaxID=29428 RepID=UPI003BAF994E
MEHLIALLPLLSSQPILQGAAGLCAVILCVWMVTRANKDKQALPPPAPAGISDVPAPFLQGPRETVDILRELRDLTRRQTEDTSAIRECARIIREQTVRQTDILDRIEREQALENRAHDREHRRD